jgi:hypothetical protein
MTMPNALLFNQAASLGGTPFGPIANIDEGAQNGIGPHILKMDAATPLIMNNCIIVLLSTPGFMDGNVLAQRTLKALWERHAKSWSGIDFGYTLDFHEQQNSNDGQQLPMPTTSKRTAVSPQVTLPEISGNLCWNFHYWWISNIQNPDTQVSQLSAMLDDGTMPQWLISTLSASMIVIQPDPTGLPERIIDAAVYTAMMPTETGNIGFKKEIGGNGESPERQITYKALVQHNQNTRELGKLIMQAQQLHKPDFTRALTFNGVDTALSGMGLSKEVNEALRDFRMVA